MYQQFDITGGALEDLTKNLGNLKHMGVDVNIHALGQVMNEFKISAEDVTPALEQILNASQRLNVPFDDLLGTMQGGSAALQTFGFTLGETLGLLGSFEDAGLPPERAINAMTKAAQTLSDAGLSPTKENLQAVFAEVQGLINSGNIDRATKELNDLFGTKAGASWLQLIKDGKLNLAELANPVEEARTSIQGMADDTYDAGDRWDMMVNDMKVAVNPLSDELLNFVNEGLGSILVWIDDHKQEIIDFFIGVGDVTIDVLKGIQTFVGSAMNDFGMIVELLGKIAGAMATFDEFMSKIPGLGDEDNGKQLRDLSDSLKDFGTNMQSAGESIQDNEAFWDDVKRKWEAAGAAAKAAAGDTAEQTTATEDAGVAADDAADKIGKQANSVDELRKKLGALATDPNAQAGKGFFGDLINGVLGGQPGASTDPGMFPPLDTGGAPGMHPLMSGRLRYDGENPQITAMKPIAERFGMTNFVGRNSHQDDGLNHPKGMAGDFSGGPDLSPQMFRFASYMSRNFGQYISELIYGDPRFTGNIGGPYDAKTLSEHRNHVHIAVKDGMAEAFMQALRSSGVRAGGMRPLMSTRPSTSAGGDIQGWLYGRLLDNGLSPDQAKGILAMNAVEGGDRDPRSLLGFVEGQRTSWGDTATGPEGHLRTFMHQWNDPKRRPADGSIPGVSAGGTVTDWNAYMTWIREKIVGQLGHQSDWQGNAQPNPQDYQRRLMQALNNNGNFEAWGPSAWNGNMPAGFGTQAKPMNFGPDQANSIIPTTPSPVPGLEPGPAGATFGYNEYGEPGYYRPSSDSISNAERAAQKAEERIRKADDRVLEAQDREKEANAKVGEAKAALNDTTLITSEQEKKRLQEALDSALKQQKSAQESVRDARQAAKDARTDAEDARGRVEDARRGQFSPARESRASGSAGRSSSVQIGAPLADDMGLSEGLPGLARFAATALANMAFAPAIGALSAMTGGRGPEQTGYGLFGMLGGRNIDAGLSPLGLSSPTMGGIPGMGGIGSPTVPGVSVAPATPSQSAIGPAPIGGGLGSMIHAGTGAPPGPGVTAQTSRQPSPGPGGGGFNGIGGLPLAGIQGAISAAGLAADAAGAYGGGSAGAAAAQLAIQLANRTAGYIGQAAAIGVGGILETVLPNNSEMADPNKSWIGRIAAGFAGARPAMPNTAGGEAKPDEQQNPAGDSQPPQTPEEAAAQAQQQNGGNNAPMVNVENLNSYRDDGGQELVNTMSRMAAASNNRGMVR